MKENVTNNKQITSTSKSKNSSIIYILENFPSNTEHFILNEIIELEKIGFNLIILSIRRQNLLLDISKLKSVKSRVIYLPRIIYYLPFLVFFCPNINITKLTGLFFYKSNTSLKNLRNYCFSIYFSNKIKGVKVQHVHAHFAFIAADVAFFLSLIMKVRYSFTAHSRDVFTLKNINEKISSAAFVITCTNYNKYYLNTISGSLYNDKIFTVHHGIYIDSWRFKSNKIKYPIEKIKILAISRLVEKKGLEYLIHAIKLLLDRGYNISCEIIGEGPFYSRLKKIISANRLIDSVKIKPFVTQNDLLNSFHQSDIFIHPSVIAEDGDRDGIPNIVLEAMASGIPVIATSIASFPEVIIDKETGILVNEKDYISIANAIVELIEDKDFYKKMVEKARRKIENDFSVENCTFELGQLFDFFQVR